MSKQLPKSYNTSRRKKTNSFYSLNAYEYGQQKDATEQLAKDIQKKYIIYTTRDDERSECWIYEEGIFKPEGKTYIKEYCRKELQELYEPLIVNKVIAKVEADTYIEQDDFFSRQNKYPNLMPVS